MPRDPPPEPKRKAKHKLNEPKWKNDLVKRIWKYARETRILRFSNSGEVLTEGLGEIITDVRNRCDRCGKSRKQAAEESSIQITRYQCCWVQTATENYCPKLCLECHTELQDLRPHAVVSV